MSNNPVHIRDISEIKRIRELRGITQDEMAMHLGYKGKSGYCQLEKGIIRMTVDKAKIISKVLNLKIQI